MKKLLLLLALLFLPALAYGQGNTVMIQYPGVPSGSCAFVMIAQNAATGDFYNCNGGAWHLVGPGAAGSAAWNTLTSGTATSKAFVNGLGTTFTSNSTATIDASGQTAENSFKIPVIAGAAPTADGAIEVDGTTHVLKFGSNGSTLTQAATGTCTNQAVTALGGTAPTCTTLTSAYVNNTIALTGTDINTSNQVTVTHLAAALPVNQGGSGATTLTGIIKGSGTSAFSAAAAADVVGLFVGCSGTQYLGADGNCHAGNAGTVTNSGTLTSGQLIIGNGTTVVTTGNLSGDATTAGATTVTVAKVNGVAYPTSPSLHSYPGVTASNTVTYKVVPDCSSDGSHALIYTQSSDTWTCQALSTGGSPAWSSIASASGTTTIANTTFDSTISNTNAHNFTFSNVTPATNAVLNQSSTIINLTGQVWDAAGPSSIADTWSIQNTLANVIDGASTLAITHTPGSTGATSVSMPGVTVNGTGAGGYAMTAGASPTPVTNSIGWIAPTTVTTAGWFAMPGAPPSSEGILYAAAVLGSVSQVNVGSVTAPLAESGGVISITGAAGKVLGGATPSFSATPVLGVNGSTAGSLGIANGGGSGATITIQNLGATSAYNFNLPTTAGSAGQCLISQGGVSTSMTWTACSGSTVTLDQVTSPVAPVAIFADGDNAIVFNSASTTSGRTAFAIGETTASTSAGTATLFKLTTLNTSTMIPLQINQGTGPSGSAAPPTFGISGGNGGPASPSTTGTGSNGGLVSMTTGNGSNGGSSTGDAGNGGAFSYTSGNGGTVIGASNNGGNGGAYTFTSGNGGNAGASGTSGNGGIITFQVGVGGTTGTVGSSGQFRVTGTAPASQSSAGIATGTIFNIAAVAGGATTGSATTGGIGSVVSINGGSGGSGAGGTNAIGGAGGAINISAGNGGLSGGSAINSNGGNIVLTPGSAGTGGGGTAGAAGVVGIVGTSDFTEVAAPSGLAGHGRIWADAAAHLFEFKANNGSANAFMGTTSTDTTTTHAVFASATAGSYTSRAIAAADLPVVATVFNSGTITVPAGNSVIVGCTSTCSVPVPVPVAGYQICVKNDAGVSTVITLSALGSSASYPKADDSGYGTAGTGTMVSTAASGNKVCLIGRDSTHYELGAINASANWTVN